MTVQFFISYLVVAIIEEITIVRMTVQVN